MSPALKKITSAMDLMLKNFENVQRASGNSVNTKDFREMHQLLDQSNIELDKMEDNWKKCNEQQDKYNEKIKKGESAAQGLAGKIAKIAGAYMSINAVKGLVTDGMNLADIQIGAQSQLKTVTANMGTGDYYNRILQKAQDIQSGGMYGDEAMIAGAAELATYFTDGDVVTSMMDTLTNYAAGMSGGAELDSTAMTNYATNLGKIMVGSFDAMNEKGFKFTETQKAIVKGTATHAQIVNELGAEYADVSSEMQAAAVINSVIDEGWANMYETMSQTPKGQIASFNNMLGDVKETIGAGLYPAVLGFMNLFNENSGQIQEFANLFVQGVGRIITVITAATNGALRFASFVQDNWGIIAPVIWGIVAALGTYCGYQLTVNAIETVSTGIKIALAAASYAHAAATHAQVSATAAETAAQYGLNTALLACPITWIILGIIAVIAVIYAVVGAINKFAGTSLSATGIICASFSICGAFIANSFVVPTWNLFAKFANFFGNVFNNPTAAVKVLFYDMCLEILGYISHLAHSIEDLLNKIPGIKVNITGGLDNFYDSLEKAQSKVKDESGWKEYVSKMDYIDYGDAAKAGYNFGKGIDAKVGSLFSYDAGEISDFVSDDFSSNLADIAESSDATAKNTSKSSEELSYLRDIAEKEAINRFTTAEIKVDMTGMTNRIDSDADVDGILSKLTRGVADALITAGEGVY